MALNELDRVEILSLQDNYIDITAMDDGDVVRRARNVRDGLICNSILAEHGFSALVRLGREGRTRTILFDFGFSEHGAAFNADALDADLREVELLVLSHGHGDHTGGLQRLLSKIGKRGLDLVVHPAAFKPDRYLVRHGSKDRFPRLVREDLEALGLRVVATREPLPLLGGDALFLGEIPRTTPFEKGMPHAFFLQDGKEARDPIEEDSSIVMRLRGKGLIVLSGCAHSGIVNTVRHAMAVTGVARVHAVMGGFHLSGPAFEAVVAPTAEAMKAIGPDYVIPCHCTGRKAIQRLEQEMPGQFILNMSGTTLTFRA
ncbi:MAG: MBL fold metallo-hydrolase [Syntrophaceae bacterium]|nr:MBL fold metallo-hydrolase [Syntrophaceae bacterium]